MKLLNKEELKTRAAFQGLFQGTNNILEVEFTFEISGMKFYFDVDCYVVCDEEGEVEAIEFNVVEENLLPHEEENIVKLLQREFKSLELC